ncbi:MAG TPA: hypothetical protein VNT33_07640 [Telluria sp.]|nr:hypothetical protein [Telluria sp.]
MATIDLNELEDATIVVGTNGAEAWACRATGRIFIRSDDLDPELEPLPDDIDTSDNYVQVPSQRDLDLGHDLAYRFTEEHMPGDYDQVRALFRKSGAYSRFADLVHKRGLRDTWHKFRDDETKAALREWCEENGLKAA